MIADRISLNLSLKYLRQFNQNEGHVIDICYIYRDQLNNTAKSIRFPDIETLEVFISTYAPLSEFQDLDCTSTYFYELAKFAVVKNETDKNIIYYDNGTYVTLSGNINKFSLDSLNTMYLPILLEAKQAFLGLKINEYILDQDGYIDCGYIETHMPGAVEELKTLYNKYKQI